MQPTTAEEIEHNLDRKPTPWQAAPQERDGACRRCGCTLVQRSWPLIDVWFPAECEACEREAAKEAALKAAVRLGREREAVIRGEIPAAYYELGEALLAGKLERNARFPEAAWERLRSWVPPQAAEGALGIDIGRGLLLSGRSGGYKTTLACILLARAHRLFGWSICYLNAAAFGAAAQDKQAWKDDPSLRRGARALLARAEKAQLTLIDDLGKQAGTATVDRQLYALLDERVSRLRPTLVTTQHTGQQLLEMLSSADRETGEAIVRRLQDYCSLVIC